MFTDTPPREITDLEVYLSSARQRIHLKHQVLFSLKNNEKNIYECRLLQSLLAL